MYNILLNVLQLLFLQQNISVVFLMLRDHYPRHNLLHKYYKDLMPNNSYIPFLSTFLYLISAVLFSFQFHFLYLRYNKPHLFHLLFHKDKIFLQLLQIICYIPLYMTIRVAYSFSAIWFCHPIMY